MTVEFLAFDVAECLERDVKGRDRTCIKDA